MRKDRQDYGKHRPNEIEPQITQFFFTAWVNKYSIVIYDKNGQLAYDGTIKYGFGMYMFNIKTNQENPQNRAVENRTDDVDQLNQIFEQCPNTGKKYGYNSPKEGEKFGNVHIMSL